MRIFPSHRIACPAFCSPLLFLYFLSRQESPLKIFSSSNFVIRQYLAQSWIIWDSNKVQSISHWIFNLCYWSCHKSLNSTKLLNGKFLLAAMVLWYTNLIDCKKRGMAMWWLIFVGGGEKCFKKSKMSSVRKCHWGDSTGFQGHSSCVPLRSVALSSQTPAMGEGIRAEEFLAARWCWQFDLISSS